MGKLISFEKESSVQDFYGVLRERVYLYLKQNNLSTKATYWMVLKSLALASFVGFFYFLIITGLAAGWWLIPVNAILGFWVAICALNIIHDALHGSYVSNPLGNRALGFVMDFFGSSSYFWKKEHTVDHHTFTNIAGHDVDIDAPDILRLCPDSSYRPIFRFQHLYGPFIYFLKFWHWAYITDTKRIIEVLNKTAKPIPKGEFFLLIAFKLIHVSIFIALPLIFAQGAWWQILLGYVAYLMAVGFTLTTIFQLAHIVEDVAFPLPNEEGKIEMSFAKHQLATTSNFGAKSRLATFLCGGLNFQVEHHLFPNLSHLLLSRIAPIVKSTAKEFGFPYHENATFISAFRSHIRTLKRFGEGP